MDSKQTNSREGNLHDFNKIFLRSKTGRTNSPSRKVLWECRKWEAGPASCLLGSAETAKSQRRNGSACTLRIEAVGRVYQGAREHRGLCWRTGWVSLCSPVWVSDSMTRGHALKSSVSFYNYDTNSTEIEELFKRLGVTFSAFLEAQKPPNKISDELQKTKAVFPPHLQCLPRQSRWGFLISL